MRSCPDTDRQAKLVRPLELGLADAADCAGFDAFLAHYKKALPLEKTATEVLRCWKIWQNS